MKVSTLITIVVVLLLLAGALRLATPKLGSVVAAGIRNVDGKSALGDCPTGSHNCTSTESSEKSTRTSRLNITTESDKVMATLLEIISEQQGATIASSDDRYIHATFASPLMGFVDDVEFLLSDDLKTIQMRSASRLGKSDLGANSKRLEKLRQATAGRL